MGAGRLREDGAVGVLILPNLELLLAILGGDGHVSHVPILILWVLCHGSSAWRPGAYHAELLPGAALLAVPGARASGKTLRGHRDVGVCNLQADHQALALAPVGGEEVLRAAGIWATDRHAAALWHVPGGVDDLGPVVISEEVEGLVALQPHPRGVLENIPKASYRLHRDHLHLRQRAKDLIAVGVAGHLFRTTLLQLPLPGDLPLVLALRPEADVDQRALGPLLVPAIDDKEVALFHGARPLDPHRGRS
mmetsp:Transcript_100540/g.239764  ORF Transcript_100540/g.239764 Transcript_100540/m.239764 type:complete len:250 (-) Transcript_100540:260-1009(-)